MEILQRIGSNWLPQEQAAEATKANPTLEKTLIPGGLNAVLILTATLVLGIAYKVFCQTQRKQEPTIRFLDRSKLTPIAEEPSITNDGQSNTALVDAMDDVLQIRDPNAGLGEITPPTIPEEILFVVESLNDGIDEYEILVQRNMAKALKNLSKAKNTKAFAIGSPLNRHPDEKSPNASNDLPPHESIRQLYAQMKAQEAKQLRLLHVAIKKGAELLRKLPEQVTHAKDSSDEKANMKMPSAANLIEKLRSAVSTFISRYRLQNLLKMELELKHPEFFAAVPRKTLKIGFKLKDPRFVPVAKGMFTRPPERAPTFVSATKDNMGLTLIPAHGAFPNPPEKDPVEIIANKPAASAPTPVKKLSIENMSESTRGLRDLELKSRSQERMKISQELKRELEDHERDFHEEVQKWLDKLAKPNTNNFAPMEEETQIAALDFWELEQVRIFYKMQLGTERLFQSDVPLLAANMAVCRKEVRDKLQGCRSQLLEEVRTILSTNPPRPVDEILEILKPSDGKPSFYSKEELLMMLYFYASKSHNNEGDQKEGIIFNQAKDFVENIPKDLNQIQGENSNAKVRRNFLWSIYEASPDLQDKIDNLLKNPKILNCIIELLQPSNNHLLASNEPRVYIVES